jgi:NADPH-dependent 2,4-dienoyl-CoA reductase/sulfur reductase-like enzyme
MRTESFDILIVGAGPAGIAAACAASQGDETGQTRRVAVVDDNPNPGGQIWRAHADHSTKHPAWAKQWFERFRSSPTTTLTSTTIIAAPRDGVLLAQDSTGLIELRYHRLILATGARERFLPFPGWTSPRVFGAGGLQALVKSGLPIANKKIIIAGSGPLLPAVAANLKKHRAQIQLIAEQASIEQLAPFAASVLTDPKKLLQSLALKSQLIGVPYRTSCWPIRAAERAHQLHLTLHSPAGPFEMTCDYLACGFFLIPNLELPALLGCDLTRDSVTVDKTQQTSLPNIYAAGESTGIGGLEKSIIEGQIAGHFAAENPTAARSFFRARAKTHRFAASLNRAFALRDELKNLPDDQTLICRCEDIPLAQLHPHKTAREAKLQTRCGMGPCQGRICAPACNFLFNWQDQSIRPPIFPSALSNFAHSPD